MKRNFFLLLMLLNTTWAITQTAVIKGVVKAATGEVLAGVTVNQKGSGNTTTTGKDGIYSIKVPSGSVLLFSYIGYLAKEEKTEGKSEINIVMELEAKDMEEVVVVGYGTSKRKDLTGAISSVSGQEIAKMPLQNPAQAMQGRIAGMQVSMADGSPGSNPTIVIRGGGSITQSNEPLYVVDGVPQTDGLNFLDPMDIESMDVLKDASATSIYGARGANGVVLVTTKQIKPTKMTVNYDGYYGIKKITKTLQVLNPYQYTQLLYERAATDAVRLPAFLNNYGPYDSLQYYYGNKQGVDWQDEIFGNAVTNQYHKISINGGSKETKFNLFYARNNDEGIMLKSGSAKNVAKLTLNHSVGKKFTVNGIVNYSDQKITGLGTQDGGNARLSMLQTLLQYRPVTGRNADDNTLAELEVDPLEPNPSSPAFQSPVIRVESQRRERTIKALNVNASIQYHFNKNLSYRGLVGYTDGNTAIKEFNEARSLLAIRSGGANGGITQIGIKRYTYSNTLNFNKTFKNQNRLDVTAGQEYVYNYEESLGVKASGFPQVNLGWDNLQLGTIAGFPTTMVQDDKLLSFFGRANYALKDRYLLTASLRYDGSSKFGDQNQWGLFPSVAVAWRIIKEGFMDNLPAFSDLKLRASYGQAGNNRIANYAALGIFSTGVYPLNNQTVATAFANNLPNPTLKWEAIEATNLGLDIGLFKQRVTLTAEVYENRSKDLLYETRIPASSGFTKQFQNIGTTSSRGLEFTLNTVNVRNADFTWNTNFNIAFNKTKVLSLSDGETSLLAPSYTTTNDFILQVGQPVGIMYGYLSDGLYQVDDFEFNATTQTYTLKQGVVRDITAVQPGFAKYKDIGGPGGKPDGLINDLDRTAIGNANPKFTGGINNTFSYKGIDLSIFMNFVYGNDIYNANVLNNSRLDLDYQNTLAVFADRWMSINAQGQRVTNPTELAALNQGKTSPVYNGVGAAQRLHNGIIEDGSFLRINNISLGYTLPKRWVGKAKITNARIYVTANNLHVFTNYTGYDPEVSVIRTALTPGVDFSAYPKARSVVAGISISL